MEMTKVFWQLSLERNLQTQKGKQIDSKESQ